MKVLIVEDNPEMRRLLRRLLRELLAGLVGEIFECDDGAEAEASYASAQPDWVLMDIAMERVDGIEATRRIKAAWPAAGLSLLGVRDRQAQATSYGPPSTTQTGVTITVNGWDDGTLATLSGNGKCDLREAIRAANTGTVVGQCPAGTIGFDRIQPRRGHASDQDEWQCRTAAGD